VATGNLERDTVTHILAKLFGGNPDRDRLYTNLANPFKQQRETERVKETQAAAAAAAAAADEEEEKVSANE